MGSSALTTNSEYCRQYRLRHRDELARKDRERLAAFRAMTWSLKSRPCSECTREYPPPCMEFDHIKGTKIGTISQMYHCNLEMVREEMAKCEVVCCNCHRVREHNRRKLAGRETKVLKNAAFRRWMNALKLRPCTDCSGRYHPVAMDFDHVRGEKVADVSAMWSWGRDKVLSEVLKCDLVCANCHRCRTHKRYPHAIYRV